MPNVGVVINRCYGGFSLSKEAVEEYLKLKGVTYSYVIGKHSWDSHFTVEGDYFSDRKIERHDPVLVQVVSRLGGKANGECAKLEVEWVQKGTRYKIDEYDGFESLESEYQVNGWSIAEY